MSESTLTITYDLIQQEIADYLGYTRTSWQKDANNAADVEYFTQSGYRQFLNPPPTLPGGRQHEWSFMRPVTTLTTTASYSTGTVTIVAGVVTLASGTFPAFGGTAGIGDLTVTATGVTYPVSTRDSSTQVTLTDTTVTAAAGSSYTLGFNAYDLPDDWGSFVSPLTYRPGTSDLYSPIDIVGEHMIRTKRQANDWFARPQVAATRPKTFDATTGQRFQITFWPTPDDAYVLTYRYNANPNKLSSTNKYPLGGMRHGETVLASCLAVAEARRNDVQGLHRARFMELLAASISWDANANSPDFLGLNNDRSDYDSRRGRFGDQWGHETSNNYVTLNGVVY